MRKLIFTESQEEHKTFRVIEEDEKSSESESCDESDGKQTGKQVRDKAQSPLLSQSIVSANETQTDLCIICYDQINAED